MFDYREKYTNYEVHKDRIDNMTIRETMEYTSNIPVEKGGIRLFMEKIVECIEELQDQALFLAEEEFHDDMVNDQIEQ